MKQEVLSVTEQKFLKGLQSRIRRGIWLFGITNTKLRGETKLTKIVFITGRPMQLPIPEKSGEVNLTKVNNLKWFYVHELSEKAV